MSTMLVQKVVIDGIVSAARAWSENGIVDALPTAARDALSSAGVEPDALGARLWQYNYDCFNFGGPPEEADPEVVAEALEDGLAERPAYSFEPLAGQPIPEKVIALLDFYRYQCEGDAWEGEKRPFEARFIYALHAATELFGEREELRGRPDYKRVP